MVAICFWGSYSAAVIPGSISPAAAQTDSPAKPAEQKPAPEKPSSEKPLEQQPSTEKPASEKPASEKPSTEKPSSGTLEPRGLRPTLPDVYYLRDSEGRLVPVPDFSYEDFKRLYDLDKRFTPALNTPNYVVQHLSITGRADQQRAVLRCDIRLVVKSDQWVRIPLQLAGAALMAAPRYDGGDSFFVDREREEGGYVAWVRDVSEKPHTLSLDLVLPVRALGDGYRLQFPAPTATTSECKISFAGQDVIAEISEPATLLALKPVADNRTELQAAGLAGETVINWRGTTSAPATATATMEASSQVLVRVEGPQRVTSEARIKVRGYGAALSAFRVRLPQGLEWFPLNDAGYRVVPVTGIDVAPPPAKPDPTADSAAAKDPDSRTKLGKIVEVIPDAKNVYQLEVRLRAVLPPPASVVEETFETVGFEVLGAVRQFGQIECQVEGEWAVDWQAGRFVLPIELPEANRGARGAARFEFYRQPCSLRVRVQPRQTRVVVDPLYVLSLGPQQTQLQATLKYRVRGPVATRLQLDLPGWQVQRVEPPEYVREEALSLEKTSPLVIPLVLDGSNGPRDFELRIVASRPTSLDATLTTTEPNLVQVPLPTAEGTLLSTARLVVVPDPSLIVTPRPRDMPGLSAQAIPAGSNTNPPFTDSTLTGNGSRPLLETPLTALAYEWRGDVTQPRFMALVERRQRSLAIDIRSSMQWDERGARVEQRLNYRIEFDPARQLPLAIARDLLRRGNLRVEWSREGGEAVPLRLNLPALDADAPPTIVANVDLPRELLGPVTLLVHYEWQRESAADSGADREETWRVPLVSPAADPNTRITSHQLEVSSTSSQPIDIVDRAWTKTADDAALASSRELTLTTNSRIDGVTLRSATAVPEVTGDIQVSKAWLQTWLDRWVRQDRVAWRVTTGQRQIDLRLPREAQMNDLLVALNGVQVKPQILVDGVVRMDLGERDPRREWLVECSYRQDLPADAIQRQTIDFPQVIGAAPAARQYWQLVLPADRYLVWAPQRWTPDAQRLSLGAAIWPELASLSPSRQANLERWMEVEPQEALPDAANEYLFSSFGNLTPVEVLVIPRSFLVLVASGATLLIGWLLWVFPACRHPAALGLLALGLVGLFGWLPTLALVLLQASVLGVVLIILLRLVPAIIARGWTRGTRSQSARVANRPPARPSISDTRRVEANDRGSSRSITSAIIILALSTGIWNSIAAAPPEKQPESPASPSPTNVSPANVSPADKPARTAERRPLDIDPIRYRRVLVREAQLPELARGYLPVKRDEFQRLLESWNSAPLTSQQPRMQQSDWWARWDRQHFSDGRFRMRVDSRHAAPGWLSLEPCRWPLRDVTWQADSAAPATSQPAAATTALPVTIGVAEGVRQIADDSSLPQNPDRSAGVGLAIVGAGELRGSWSWRGREIGPGVWQLDADLPPGAWQRLWLDLPAELRLEADNSLGELLLDRVDPRAREAVAALPSGWDVPAVESPQWQRWLVQPLAERIRLLIHDDRRREEHNQSTHWRQDLVYEVTPQGIELLANLRLDILGEPLRKLQLDLPIAMKIGALRMGDQTLEWREQWKSDGATRIVEVDLPELRGVDQLIQLTALAPLPEQSRIDLPAPNLRGLFWQEGKVTVSVYQPLEATALMVPGGRDLRVSNVATPTPATVFQMQLPARDVPLQLLAQTPAPQWSATIATTHQIEEANWEARAVVQATVTSGRATDWQARVPRDWVIDRVEWPTELTGEDYEVIPADDPGYQLLRVRFAEPLTTGRGMRLEIHANRPRPAAGTRLYRPQFQLVDLLGGQQPHRSVDGVIAVQLDAATRIVWHRDRELVWLTPDKLTADEQQMLEPHEGATLWRDDEAARELEMEFALVPPVYSARVEIQARVSDQGITESSRLLITPVQGEVTRLLVVFSQARENPLNWSIVEQDTASLAIRKLNDQQLQAIASSAREGWEILLRTPRADPFELRCERFTKWPELVATGGGAANPEEFDRRLSSSLISLPLVTLPEADQQLGMVRLECRDVPLLINAPELTALPVTAAENAPEWTTMAAYRYEPTNIRELSLQLDPERSSLPSAWAWSSQLSTQFARTGEAWYAATYWIENRGKSEIKVQFPEGANGWQIFVDRVLQSQGAIITTVDQKQVVALKPGERFTELHVKFRLQGEPWRFWGHYQPQSPTISIPVRHGTWRCWLPRGFVPWQAAPMAAPTTARQAWQRLLSLVEPSSSSLTFATQDTPLAWSSREDALREAWQLDWSGLRGESPAAGDQQAVSLLLILGRVMTEADLTWQQVWRGFQVAVDDLRPAITLMMDGNQLAAQGILPAAKLSGPFPIPPRSAKHVDPALDQFVESERERMRYASEVDRYLARHGIVLRCYPAMILVSMATARDRELSTGSRWQSIQILSADKADSLPTDRRSSVVESQAAPSGMTELNQWLTLRGPPELPWSNRPVEPPLPEVAGPAWDHPWPSQVGKNYQVIDGGLVLVFAWASLLVTASWLVMLARRWPSLLAAAPAIAAALTWFFPACLASLGSGLFLGSLLAIVWHLTRRPRSRALPSATASVITPRRLALTTTILLFIGWTVWWQRTSNRVWAEDPSPSEAVTYRVLFPVNDEGQASGEYVHVPREFYDRLRSQSGPERGNLPAIIWRQADYEFEFRETNDANRWQVPTLRIRWELSTSRENQWVALPLQRDTVSLLSQSWRHEDQAVDLLTEVTEAGWRVELPRVGNYHVELVVRPLLQRRLNQIGVYLAVPRLPGASVMIRGSALPQLQNELSFPTAEGATKLQESRKQLQVDLGSSDELAIEWTRGALESDVRVDHLAWWQIRPGAIALKSQLTFRAEKRLPRTMRVAVDRRLRLLPSEEGQPALRWVTNSEGDPWVEWDWSEEVSDSASIRLSFLWIDAAGVGHWQPPRIEPLEARLERHWLAISTFANLQAHIVGLPPEAMLNVEQFAEAWPLDMEPPQLALQLAAAAPQASDLPATASNPAATNPGTKAAAAAASAQSPAATSPSMPARPWYVAIVPREPLMTGDERLSVTVSRTRTQWQLRSQVTLPTSALQIMRWRVPLDATIEDVRVVGSDEVDVASWQRDADLLYVRLSQPITAACRFIIEGSMATPMATPTQLVDPYSLDLVDHPVSVRLFRDGTVRVDFLEPPPTVEEPDEWQGSGQAERLLSQWTQRRGGLSQQSAVVYSALPNQPQASGRQLTVMQVDETGSRTLVTGNVQVVRDPVDLLRWEVPRDWSVNDRAWPRGIWSLRPSPTAEKQILELRLPQPRTGLIHFAFAGPALPLGEQRQGIPLVRLLDMESSEHFLSLPTIASLGQMAWETSGMEAINVPEQTLWLKSEWLKSEELVAWLEQVSEMSALTDPAPRTTYRLIGQRWRAQLRSVESAVTSPRVLLAEQFLDVDPEGGYWCLALFDVAVGKQGEQQLELPAEAELVHADVDGSAAGWERRTARTWIVRWGISEGPRHVRVLFRGRVRATAQDQVDQPVARLIDIPVERTLGSVRLSQQGFWQMVVAPSRTLSPLQYAQARLAARTDVVQVATESLLQQSPRDQDVRLVPWSRQWFDARTALEQAALEQTVEWSGEVAKPATDATATASDDVRQLALLNQRQLDLEKQLPSPEAWETGRQQAEQGRDWDQIWRHTHRSSRPQYFARQPSSPGELPAEAASFGRLEPRGFQATDWMTWLPPLVLVLVGLVAQFATAHGRLTEVVGRAPHGTAAVLGLIWWFWLPGAPGGLILLLLAGVDSLRSPWRYFRR